MTNKLIPITEAALYGLPDATDEQPFAQIDWIFGFRRSLVRSLSGKDNYTYALAFYLRFVRESAGLNPFLLKEQWDSLALVRFRVWLMNLHSISGKPFGTHTLVGVMSAVRQVMDEASRMGLAKAPDIINVSMPQAHRNTAMHDAYSNSELEKILHAVRQGLQYTNAVLAGYKRRNIGRDPQIRPDATLRINPQKYAEHGYGWNCEANMHWYFENRMDCRPTSRINDGSATYSRFAIGASRYHGGTVALYKRWGVTPYIDRDILFPLVIQLSYLSGLNPLSIALLKTNCLQEHPLTGTPVLHYFKLRSLGEKELLLDLLNDGLVHDEDFEEEALPLKREQAVLVQRVINKILKLTLPLRGHPEFPIVLKENLLVYQSSGNNCFGEFQAVPVWKMNQWCRELLERHNLTSDNGEPLSFSMVRFRPTKLTQMAAQGKDFFEIQHAAGHKSLMTTLHYIEQRTYDALAEREISSALETIWGNREEFSIVSEKKECSTAPILFKGLISNCKNVFDPPRSVQLSADYVDGQPCTRFNMCLLCKNVVVMQEHLPHLALYRNQIRGVINNPGLDFPHGVFYEKTISVLDQIFDPEVSEFGEEELDEAVAIAECLDVVIDPLVYPVGSV